MASGNRDARIRMFDAAANRVKEIFLNPTTGRIENLPSRQRLVLDIKSGKLITESDRLALLDKQVVDESFLAWFNSNSDEKE